MLGEDQRKNFPSVSALLEGIRDEKGEEVVPQFRLTIWAASEGIDFAFFCKEKAGKSAEAYFGTVGASTHLLENVELALSTGEFTVRRVDQKVF
jgi:hypothetical protein